MGASRPDIVAPLLGALVLAAAPLAAQAPLTIAGQVVRIASGDTVAAPAVPVTLHRVARTSQGAVDSASAAQDGRIRFRLTGDTTAIYIVSARYAGLEYFSEPIRAPGASELRLVVFDTSSSAPVRLSGRHVIVRAPDASGRRTVLDLLSLRNAGDRTRVAPDSTSASWALALPPGVEGAEVQDGDVSPAAVRFDGDSVWILAPLPPGLKNVMLSYQLPLGVEGTSWSAPVDSFDLLVEEPGARVDGAGLAAVEPMMVAGTPLHRWTVAPPTGGAARLRLPDSAPAQERLLFVLVALLATALLGGGWFAVRRRAG